jgi:hypothetical protein
MNPVMPKGARVAALPPVDRTSWGSRLMYELEMTGADKGIALGIGTSAGGRWPAVHLSDRRLAAIFHCSEATVVRVARQLVTDGFLLDLKSRDPADVSTSGLCSRLVKPSTSRTLRDRRRDPGAATERRACNGHHQTV